MSRLVERAGLAGRKAVIIGGASGIGAAVTLALAGEGVDVAFCDIVAAAIEPTRKDAEALGVATFGAQADAIDRAALAAFYDGVEARFGGIDILVNLAGGTLRRNFDAGDSEADDRDIRRNYGYILDSTRRALPLIRQSGRGGSIINFTTIEAHRGAASFAVYAGAKAATANFTAALAVELGAERIRVNCIAPDTTPSAGNANAVPGIGESFLSLPEHVRGAGIDLYVPMKTVPMPEDLADAVLFLASDLSRFMTGTTLHVDGGTKAASGFLDWPYGDGFVPAPLAGTVAKLFASD
jgi:NAD(P)-dependent dehydrogenase (short-subunit alcohol dehydrogenase family)